MKKKIMAVTLCLAMVSTFAVGCGQKNETDSGKSEEKSSGKVEIEFVQVKREAAESYTKVIEAFEKENPDIVIKQNVVPDAQEVLMTRVLLGTGISMVCILMAAFPLSRTKKQFPKRDIFMWIFVFCMLFNGGTVPWYITMKNYNLMDNIFGLVLGTGLQVFNVILAVNFFKNLPTELEEACFVDGGGPWRNLISIYVPLAKPMVATVALFTMVMYWNEFFQGMVLSTRQSSYPLQTYIQQMVVTLDYSTMNVDQIAQAMKLNNLSLDSAKIFIAMIPVLIVYPFLQRYFVEGITLGSVKG